MAAELILHVQLYDQKTTCYHTEVSTRYSVIVILMQDESESIGTCQSKHVYLFVLTHYTSSHVYECAAINIMKCMFTVYNGVFIEMFTSLGIVP